ncbi:glycosyltransferase [Anaeromyxobacter sp. SG17]|uniref:glycosyltransferase n=1 Tax=Anaeromyxobacter sp. SG17 TaxID=2925405 RepID=UPI001F597EB9|nr:glycosyltransferase [Anaeromyxobacter sp. SG17]
MRVTVLTPTLDAERFLPDCIASVRAQEGEGVEIEHLVIDGQSSDRTVELARAGGADVHVARDGSLYEALNRGVRLARGDVIAWLNADDTFEPGALAKAVSRLERTPSAELVIGHYAIARGGRRRIMRTRADALVRIRSGVRQDSWVTPLAVLYRSDTLRRLGEYASSYRIAADLDLWLRAAAREPPLVVAHCGAVIGTFRVHEDSLSTGTSPERSLKETIEIARGWYDRADTPEGVRAFARYLYRRHEFLLRIWQLRTEPRWRKAMAAYQCYRELSTLGPGTLRDFLVPLSP